MAVPKSAYQSPTYHPSGHHPNGYQSAYQAGYQAGYSNQQQKDDRISLPGIREILPEYAAHSKPQAIPHPLASPGAWSHSDAATTTGHYTQAQPERPFWFDHPRLSVDEGRGRVEEWRREQERNVPRRYPTTPPQPCPLQPSISSPFEYPARNFDDSRASYGPGNDQFDYRRGSSSSGYGQDGYPPRQGSRQGGYSQHQQQQQSIYDPHSYSHGHAGYADGSSRPSSHHAPAAGSPHHHNHNHAAHRGRKRSATGEEAEEAERKRRNFSTATIDVFKRWAEKKIDHLHFTNEEKAEIAREVGLEIKQVDDWFTNHRRRGYPQQRYQFHLAALASVDAAYAAAREEVRRVGELGGSGEARVAAEAKVARLAALKDETEDRLQKASEALDEHKGRRVGGRGRRREGEE